MKHIYYIPIKYIIHYFQQTAIAGNPKKKVFVFLSRQGMIKHSPLKSIQDVLLCYSMFERTRFESKFLFHVQKYKLIKIVMQGLRTK